MGMLSPPVWSLTRSSWSARNLCGVTTHAVTFYNDIMTIRLELSTIAALARNREPRKITTGDVIFRAGEPGDCLFGILTGTIQLSWGADRVETLGPGSCFGVGALVDPDHRRFGTATAISDGELLEMNRQEFLFAMQELPMFGLEMLHDLEQRLQRLKEQGAET
jgi:CRP-like cAMP-binding protein